MYFIGIKIILPRPMGQKISGCKMTGFDTVAVAICKRYLGPNRESFLNQSIITQQMWAVSSSGQGLFWKNSN